MTILSPHTPHDDAVSWLQALESRSQIHDVTVNGCLVRWRRWGEGRPLVLIHGGSGNWAHWARNIDHLSTGRAVWVPDMPGFGDSQALDPSIEGAELLTHLVQVLSNSLDAVLGENTEIDLAGFSFGGLVAGTLASRRGKVRKLALLGTAGHGGPKRKIPELVQWRLPDRADMLQALRHNLGQLMLHHPSSIDALAMAIHEGASLATRFRSKSLSMDMDLQITLATFSSPVLMVWGEHDVIAVPELAAARLMQGHPERRFHLVRDVGHWVQFEAFERVNPLLANWLAS
jgi:pimeloyl-ACP methyl ester carboxylesterase